MQKDSEAFSETVNLGDSPLTIALKTRNPLRKVSPLSPKDQKDLELYGELLSKPEQKRIETICAHPDILEFDEEAFDAALYHHVSEKIGAMLLQEEDDEPSINESATNSTPPSNVDIKAQTKAAFEKARAIKNKTDEKLYLELALMPDSIDRINRLRSMGSPQYNKSAIVGSATNSGLNNLLENLATIKADPDVIDQSKSKLQKQAAYLKQLGIAQEYITEAGIKRLLKYPLTDSIAETQIKSAFSSMPPVDRSDSTQSLYKTLAAMDDTEIRIAHLREQHDVWTINENALAQLPKASASQPPSVKISATPIDKAADIRACFAGVQQEKHQKALALYTNLLKGNDEQAISHLKQEKISLPHWAAIETFSPDDQKRLFGIFRKIAPNDDIDHELFYRMALTLNPAERRQAFKRELNVSQLNDSALSSLSEHDQNAIIETFGTTRAAHNAETEKLYRNIAAADQFSGAHQLLDKNITRVDKDVLESLPVELRLPVLAAFKKAITQRFSPKEFGEKFTLKEQALVNQELARLDADLPKETGNDLKIRGKKLGQGGFGAVYPVMDEYGQPFVAKIITLDEKYEKAALASGKTPEEAKIEAQTKARIKAEHEIRMHEKVDETHHPNVVRCYGVRKIPFPDGEKDALILEYLPGQDAQDVVEKMVFALANGQITHQEFFDGWSHIVVGALEGARHIASKGVAHADLKLPNIMIANGRPVVIDMGLNLHKAGNHADKPDWYEAPETMFNKNPSDSWREPSHSDSPLTEIYGADALGIAKMFSELESMITNVERTDGIVSNPIKFDPQAPQTSVDKFMARLLSFTDFNRDSFEFANPTKDNQAGRLPKPSAFNSAAWDYLRDRADAETGAEVLRKVANLPWSVLESRSPEKSAATKTAPTITTAPAVPVKKSSDDKEKDNAASLLRNVDAFLNNNVAAKTNFEKNTAEKLFNDLDRYPIVSDMKRSAGTLRLSELNGLTNTDDLQHLESIAALRTATVAYQMAPTVMSAADSLKQTFPAETPLSLLQQLRKLPPTAEVEARIEQLRTQFRSSINVELKTQQWQREPEMQAVERAHQVKKDLGEMLAIYRLVKPERDPEGYALANQLKSVIDQIDSFLPSPEKSSKSKEKTQGIGQITEEAEELIATIKESRGFEPAKEVFLIQQRLDRLSNLPQLTARRDDGLYRLGEYLENLQRNAGANGKMSAILVLVDQEITQLFAQEKNAQSQFDATKKLLDTLERSVKDRLKPIEDRLERKKSADNLKEGEVGRSLMKVLQTIQKMRARLGVAAPETVISNVSSFINLTRLDLKELDRDREESKSRRPTLLTRFFQNRSSSLESISSSSSSTTSGSSASGSSAHTSATSLTSDSSDDPFAAVAIPRTTTRLPATSIPAKKLEAIKNEFQQVYQSKLQNERIPRKHYSTECFSALRDQYLHHYERSKGFGSPPPSINTFIDDNMTKIKEASVEKSRKIENYTSGKTVPNTINGSNGGKKRKF